MPYFSKFYQIKVRDEIAEEWMDSEGNVDDMLAGLHEIRARRAEEIYDLKGLEKRVKEKGRFTKRDMEVFRRG